MIQISCTNCKTLLSIDDAFAGGVCRCQHCGTIQTVPAKARESTTAGAPAGPVVAAKSLYQSDARPDASGTGLDSLAGVIVSSGLSSSRLTTPAQRPPAHKNLLPILIGVGFVVLALLGVIVYLMTRPGTSTTPNTPGENTNTVQTPGTPTPVAGPNFCGTKLDGSPVIYVLDSGTATQEYFGELKDVTLHSIATLGSDRKFEILFWTDKDKREWDFPNDATTPASPENIKSAASTIADAMAFGKSDPKPALEIAFAQRPDTIVLATAKGWEFDAAWVTDVMALRGTSTAKIDTFDLGATEPSQALKDLAAKTGGVYTNVSKSDLSQANR